MNKRRGSAKRSTCNSTDEEMNINSGTVFGVPPQSIMHTKPGNSTATPIISPQPNIHDLTDSSKSEAHADTGSRKIEATRPNHKLYATAHPHLNPIKNPMGNHTLHAQNNLCILNNTNTNTVRTFSATPHTHANPRYKRAVTAHREKTTVGAIKATVKILCL